MKTNITEETGFTLIEMLAVLFIIGIVFSIALPAIGPISTTMKVNTSTENLANAIEAGRQYAITSGRECNMVFLLGGGSDLSNKVYKTVYRDDEDNYHTIGKVEILPTGIEIDGTNSEISNGATISVPFPEDSDGLQALEYIVLKTNGGITMGGAGSNGHIRLWDKNKNIFREVTFYNQPREIRIEDISG